MEGIRRIFRDGKVNGKSIQYYPSGAIKGEIPHVNGEAHGNGISYRKDGSKMFVTPYVRGKRQGTAMHYHEDGTKWEEVIWENGKEVFKKELLKRPNLTFLMYLFRLLF